MHFRLFSIPKMFASHTFIPSMAEAGRSPRVPGQPGLRSEARTARANTKKPCLKETQKQKRERERERNRSEKTTRKQMLAMNFQEPK